MAVVPSVETLGYSRDVPPGQGLPRERGVPLSRRNAVFRRHIPLGESHGQCRRSLRDREAKPDPANGLPTGSRRYGRLEVCATQPLKPGPRLRFKRCSRAIYQLTPLSAGALTWGMKTNNRALGVWRIRRWTGQVALLALTAAVLGMACEFGRNCGQRLAPRGAVNETADWANLFAVK